MLLRFIKKKRKAKKLLLLSMQGGASEVCSCPWSMYFKNQKHIFT